MCVSACVFGGDADDCFSTIKHVHPEGVYVADGV